jgi:hypothetical protein
MQMNLKGLALAALVTLAGAGIASAQSPSAQNPAPSQEPSGRQAQSITGELTRVNPDTKMFTVKNATGEIQFQYSDQTMVTGAQKSVAGLATAHGEQVTVTYRVDGTTNMATKIEVKEKK